MVRSGPGTSRVLDKGDFKKGTRLGPNPDPYVIHELFPVTYLGPVQTDRVRPDRVCEPITLKDTSRPRETTLVLHRRISRTQGCQEPVCSRGRLRRLKVGRTQRRSQMGVFSSPVATRHCLIRPYRLRSFVVTIISGMTHGPRHVSYGRLRERLRRVLNAL